MKRILLALLALAAIPAAQAQLFVDSFDPPSITPQFPFVAGAYQLPPGPAVDQLQWLVSELAAGETTTLAEVSAHFDPSFNYPGMVSFINQVRSEHPNARISDVVTVTPVTTVVVIDSPGDPSPSGYMIVGAHYTGAKKIVEVYVFDYFGSVQYPADQTLTMAQAATKFATLSSAPSLLVGRINSANQCTTIQDRNANTPRATASIFKTWVLGGVGQSIVEGTLSSTEILPMVASELAPGGTINSEPLNTPFPLSDLATLMMGISDNTATDLLHERVGRTRLDQIVTEYGVAQPNLLQPLLGISEQFHLFLSFPLAQALTYVNGTQPFKYQFLHDNIEPLGPNNGGPYFHESLLTSGTWRASPFDICRAFAKLRRLPQGSEAFKTVDAALGAGAAQPEVRDRWDRVWYKGGDLTSGANGKHVLTHAWMLENAGEDPYVLIAMSNSNTGGIDEYNVQSVTGRMLELLSQR
ncbi:MAG TPA: serine hydrolase [Dokdonella sp.]|uniref:serine hydrolase n=1 Tax=Dokdonella sp. TaxID=2291710 RepID=UPI002D7FE40F|nr:serine hydrolase [Dokdonella sp.]HET9033575.1 serine hydrolase [Dokdonella sp.]